MAVRMHRGHTECSDNILTVRRMTVSQLMTSVRRNYDVSQTHARTRVHTDTQT